MTNATIAATKPNRDKSAKLSWPPPRSDWPRVGLICLLLVVSGAIRYGREWKVQSLSAESKKLPFKLTAFPKDLGSWRAKEGADEVLDPEIRRIAGAVDHVIRTYVDQKSGESAVVMIIYGPATEVWPHVPAVCYPANGFRQLPEKSDLEIPIPGTTAKARFRMESFARYPRPGERVFREVYHSFRNAGVWGLDMENNWKQFRDHPGMFKVQVERQTSRSNIENADQSFDEFLGQIVGEIEQGLAEKH